MVKKRKRSPETKTDDAPGEVDLFPEGYRFISHPSPVESTPFGRFYPEHRGHRAYLLPIRDTSLRAQCSCGNQLSLTYLQAIGGTMKKTEPTADVPYEQLDPGIRETVRWLNNRGFKTTDSGDGRTKPRSARTVEGPHVFITTTPDQMRAEADRLWGDLQFLGRVGRSYAQVEASYDPGIKSAVILLSGVEDTRLQQSMHHERLLEIERRVQEGSNGDFSHNYRRDVLDLIAEVRRLERVVGVHVSPETEGPR